MKNFTIVNKKKLILWAHNIKIAIIISGGSSMEVIAFSTNNVEDKLQDIRCALTILSFAVNGLHKYDLIDNNEVSGFEYVIEEANKNVTALIKSMRPLGINGDRVMLLTCVEK